MPRGPSFAGPLTGWTSSSLTPATTAAATSDQQLSAKLAEKGWTFKPGSGWTSGAPAAVNPATGQPFSYALAGASDINPLTLSPLSDETIQARQRWQGRNIPNFQTSMTDEAVLRGLAVAGEGGFGGASRGGSGSGGRGGTDSSGGLAAGGRGAGFSNRGTFTQPTPLEALLASVFPDAAMGEDPNPLNPNTAAPQQSALFRTILGNLGGTPTAGVGAPAQVQGPSFGDPSMGAQIASTIPGAPPFLAGAINRVGGAAMPAPVAPPGPAFDAAGLAALAAEQRAQANQMAAEKQAAETAYFQQQQQQQKAANMVAQRQRQRFGGVNAITSGWANNPPLY